MHLFHVRSATLYTIDELSLALLLDKHLLKITQTVPFNLLVVKLTTFNIFFFKMRISKKYKWIKIIVRRLHNNFTTFKNTFRRDDFVRK